MWYFLIKTQTLIITYLMETKNKHFYGVIMAGGVGSRFWPVSTPDEPKQFHDMVGAGKSLLQQTQSRLEKLIPDENIYVSTNERHINKIKEQLPNLNDLQIVPEPVMRNTAPAVLYSVLKIYQKDPDALILIAPSDHAIKKEAVFIDHLNTAFNACEKNDILMTFGIMPTYPNTGYGYIQYKKDDAEIKVVEKFTEKPDINTAQKFLEEGNYLWNSGMFIWSAKSIIKAFKMYLPNMISSFEKNIELLNTDAENKFINEIYPSLENIALDYGILERSNNVMVLPVDIDWNDLGTWKSLHSELPKDNNDNVILNENSHLMDTHNNIIYTQKHKKVILKGLENYIIVETNDVLLVIPKDDEQSIKELSQLPDK